MDGPTHYCRSAIAGDKVDARSKRIRGAFLMKESLLTLQGYKVLHVPYYEWDMLSNIPNKKEEYLREKLNGIKVK